LYVVITKSSFVSPSLSPLNMSTQTSTGSNVVSLSTFAFFFFCFLYVNVECSLIIHVGDCHALGYDVDATFVIFPTCHNVILFQSLHYWELAMYMFGMLSTLNFIFVMTIWDDIFVFMSLSHFCVVSLSTFAFFF